MLQQEDLQGLCHILLLDVWKDAEQCDIRLTKLHGSVDWHQQNGTIHCGSPIFAGHGKHAILYPGFKGEPKEPHFKLFHNHFKKVLSECHAAVFIGFDFRDEHINTLMADHLNPNAPIVLIDPGNPSADCPFRKRILHHRGGFDTKAVEYMMKMLANP